MGFKVGDKVKFKNPDNNFPAGLLNEFVLACDGHGEDKLHVLIGHSRGTSCFKCNSSWEVKEEELELIETKQNIIMNIKETFALALTPEPQKSFRKAGITNGDNILTDDGVKVFLTYLLGKNQDAFKTDVVDALLVEIANEKK
jgi:hypothetical protein